MSTNLTLKKIKREKKNISKKTTKNNVFWTCIPLFSRRANNAFVCLNRIDGKQSSLWLKRLFRYLEGFSR